MKPETKTQAPEDRNEIQHDLDGAPVRSEASVEYVETVTMLVLAPHFYTRSRTDWGDKVRAAKTQKGRLGLVLKRMRPFPDVEEIPHGAKLKEAEEIVKALTLAVER